MYTYFMESNTPTPLPPILDRTTIQPPKRKILIFQNFSNYFFKNITVISIGSFILLAIGLVAFFYYQNQNLKQMLAKYAESSPTPIATSDPLANWKIYKSSLDGYQFKVPQEWGQSEQSKELPHKTVFQSADGLYRFTANAEANKNKVTGKTYESIDEFIGLPYTIKALKVGGSDARQPLPKAGFENFDKVYFFSQDASLILSLELLVGDGTKTDHRVTFESLQIGADIFEKILSTFKFTSPPPTNMPIPTNNDTVSSPSGKVCTMEAKICPDGSGVGRTGPNCEFAPCPTAKP
jgi:hypothetical protein